MLIALCNFLRNLSHNDIASQVANKIAHYSRPLDSFIWGEKIKIIYREDIAEDKKKTKK